MLNITSISNQIDRPYNDTLISGTNKKEVPAPVLASYDVTISHQGVESVFWVEVRTAPQDTLQVDWSDDLQNLLSQAKAKPEAWSLLSNLIHDHYSGVTSDLPLQLPSDA